MKIDVIVFATHHGNKKIAEVKNAEVFTLVVPGRVAEKATVQKAHKLTSVVILNLN